jgi:hypothetical protein
MGLMAEAPWFNSEQGQEASVFSKAELRDSPSFLSRVTGG